MVRPEKIQIARHLTIEELEKLIRFLEKSTRILKRLYFVKFRYKGDTVQKAAEKVGTSKRNAYIWQERWNEKGYEGLALKFGGGRPSKLTENQKKQLRKYLEECDNWTTDQVRKLIFEKFNVTYTLKQIRIILRKMKMNYAKPYQFDYRRPNDAVDILKKNSRKSMTK